MAYAFFDVDFFCRKVSVDKRMERGASALRHFLHGINWFLVCKKPEIIDRVFALSRRVVGKIISSVNFGYDEHEMPDLI